MRADPRTHPLALVGLALGCAVDPSGTGGAAANVTGGGGSSFVNPGVGGGMVCEGAASPVDPSPPCDPGATPIGFAKDVAPLLAGCARELCHGPIEHEHLVGRIAVQCSGRLLVAPGEPESSYLVDKLRGERLCCGTRMPQGDPPMAASDQATIERWICQGAVP